MGFKTPGEVYAAVELAGARKTHDMPWHRTLTQGFLAGLYTGFGATSAITCGYGLPPQWIIPGPGLRSLVFGAVFPVGIILVVFTGAELLTGNMMIDVIDLIHRRSKKTLIGVLRNWTLSWIGNFAGALFCSYFLAYQTGLFAAEPFLSAVKGIAEKKVNILLPYQIFLRAIGCNTLVCLSIFCNLAADDVFGKCFALWFPIMTFAAIGYEHVVANMFFIPCGLFYGADEYVSWGVAIYKNILLVTAGNLVGAIVMCDFFFWFGFGRVFMDAHPIEDEEKKPSKKKRFMRRVFAPNPRKTERKTDHLPKHPVFMTDITSLLPLEPLCVTYESPSYQKRFRRKDGSIVDVKISGMPIGNERGKATRKQSVDVKASDLVIVVDGNGRAKRIEDVDESFAEKLGYHHDEMGGPDILDETPAEGANVNSKSP
eukprot:CAMPEP_0196654310 /NCGR_PEP_ID=MMETSP1086-20130531/4016_1 /TAXON_ID=77921 /ORGANISM="Cyanoptyche  gloeocystis , Strain SAG4.97" /LENGTH=427 /DNA_ID=CAMNT_0041985995 /DNA_START=24 /DNA_END=1307 /DNA_ORIENTATION=-